MLLQKWGASLFLPWLYCAKQRTPLAFRESIKLVWSNLRCPKYVRHSFLSKCSLPYEYKWYNRCTGLFKCKMMKWSSFCTYFFVFEVARLLMAPLICWFYLLVQVYHNHVQYGVGTVGMNIWCWLCIFLSSLCMYIMYYMCLSAYIFCKYTVIFYVL